MTAAGVAEHPFDSDTRVIAQGDGRFEGTLSGRWNALGGVVNGGYYVAVCLAALREVLAHPEPLVVSSFFLRPGRPGPVEVRTDVAKGGRRHSTAEARLWQDGKELVRTTATFATLADDGSGPQAAFTSPPVLPPPDECADPTGGMSLPELTLLDQVEFRSPEPPGWMAGRPSGDPAAEFWLRFTGGREPDAFSLPMLVDAGAPVVLELGVAGSATVELTTHVRGRPAPGWLACRGTTRHVGGGYHEEDFEIWDSQGRLVAQSRQLGLVLTAP